MVKAVIFDLDGVIVDSEPAYRAVDMKIFDILGIWMKSEEYDTWMGTAGDEMFAQLKKRHDIEYSVEDLTKMQLDFMIQDFKQGKFGEIEGAKDLIRTLYDKGANLAVASSSAMVYINEILKSMEVEHCFKTKISGENIKRTKPAPDIYIHCAKRLGVDCKDCIAIEDSKNGIASAKKAGMKCIAFKSSPGRNQSNDMADYVFDNMADIKKCLTELIFHED